MPDAETGLSLSEAFTYLVSTRQRNFYARVINALVRVETPGLNTLAVGLDKTGRYVFYYDPDFVRKCTIQELVLSCEHEVYHLLLGHIPRFLELLTGLTDQAERRKFKSVMNIAVDCATNELMRTEDGFDKRWGKWFYGDEKETEGRTFLVPENFKLPKGLPYEAYQFMLLRNAKQISAHVAGGVGTATVVPMEGDAYAILDGHFQQQTRGAHQFWDNGLDQKASDEIQGMADKLRQQVKNMLQQAVNEHTKSRGTIPAGMRELVEALLKPPTIPWPELLRNFCVRTRQTKIGRGMSRPNRRMHGIPGVLPFPGRARDRKFTILFALDTSGSMSTDDLKLGLTELCHLAKADSDITIQVLHCDAEVHHVYTIRSVGDVDFTVHGRGGTSFDPVFIKAQKLLRTEKAFDLLIYCTDGYAPAPAPENRVPTPVVWLTTPTGVDPSPGYGVVIRMEPF